MDEAFITIWVLLCIPLLGVALYPLNVVIGNVFRERRHRMVRDVLNERLDVVRTAIAMGYNEDQLAELDARLERLVGRPQLEALLTQDKPVAGVTQFGAARHGRLPSTDLEDAQAAPEAQSEPQTETEP